MFHIPSRGCAVSQGVTIVRLRDVAFNNAASEQVLQQCPDAGCCTRETRKFGVEDLGHPRLNPRGGLC